MGQVFSSSALAGKVALVTGAARGIGRAAAVALAEAGADVIGLDVCAVVDPRSGVKPATVEELSETGAQVKRSARRWEQYVVDQRDLAALQRVAADIEENFSSVDVVFANAGIQSFHPLLEMEDADWNITIDTNLTGTANVLRAFGPGMVKRGAGRMILTTSTQGQHGTLHAAAYSASKWGILGLMKSAALELGKHGVTVNALVPGLIDTPLTRHEERYAQALEKAGKVPTGDAAEDEKAAEEALTKSNPMRVPWIEPKAVAPMVVFLASEAAAMIRGGVRGDGWG